LFRELPGQPGYFTRRRLRVLRLALPLFLGVRLHAIFALDGTPRAPTLALHRCDARGGP